MTCPKAVTIPKKEMLRGYGAVYSTYKHCSCQSKQDACSLSRSRSGKGCACSGVPGVSCILCCCSAREVMLWGHAGASIDWGQEGHGI